MLSLKERFRRASSKSGIYASFSTLARILDVSALNALALPDDAIRSLPRVEHTPKPDGTAVQTADPERGTATRSGCHRLGRRRILEIFRQRHAFALPAICANVGAFFQSWV
jgi:hypothetical protein